MHVGGDHEEAVHAALQHQLRLGKLRVRIVIRSRQNHRVAVLLGERVDGVSDRRKERIEKIRNNDADGVRLEPAQRARHLVGPITELFDGPIDPLCRFRRNRCGFVQHARHGHRAHAGHAGNIIHCWLAIHTVLSPICFAASCSGTGCKRILQIFHFARVASSMSRPLLPAPMRHRSSPESGCPTIGFS